MVRSPDLWIPILFRKSSASDWENAKYAAIAGMFPISQTPSNSVAPGKDYLGESSGALYLFGRLYRFYPFYPFTRLVRFIRFNRFIRFI